MPRSFHKPHIPSGVRKRGIKKDWMQITSVVKKWPTGRGAGSGTQSDSILADAHWCRIKRIVVAYSAALGICNIYEHDGTTVAYQFEIEASADAPRFIDVDLEMDGGFFAQTTSALALFNIEFEYK